MNYVARFGMEFNPFLKNSKCVVYAKDDYEELLYRLNYLIQVRGFGVVTGPPGVGKTTIIKHWVDGLNTSLYKVIYLPLSTVSVSEFYRQLAEAFGMTPKFTKHKNFDIIQEAISHYVNDLKMTPIIVIDEAQYLRDAIMRDIKMMFNFAMDSKDQAIVLFVGLPYFNNLLRQVANEPLKQRIIMNYNLVGINKLVAEAYIKHKISAAGSRHDIFGGGALEAIINYSAGVPRVIDKVINCALLIADSRNESMISAEIVEAAIGEITIS